MKRFLYILFLLLLTMTPVGRVCAEVTTADGRVLTEEQLDSLRQTEDFVNVSLCIAEPTRWQDDFSGITGHAWLRLQCPIFDLDYCFSYETLMEDGELIHLLRNDMIMGLFTIPTNEYIQSYQKWNRAVHEYSLNLPADAKVRLWKIMDQHAAEGTELSHDMVKRGCTLSIVHFIKQSLGEKEIVYAKWPEVFKKTRYEIILNELQAYPWIQIMSEFTSDNRFKKTCTNEEKLIIPHYLAEAWEQANIDGTPLLQYKGDLVRGSTETIAETKCTPIRVAIALLILTICFAFCKWPYWDWIVLGLQAILGVLICTVLTESAFGQDEAMVLAIVINPFPALLWQWRKYWSLWYALLIGIWLVAVNIIPSLAVNMTFQILACCIMLTFLKEPIRGSLKQ